MDNPFQSPAILSLCPGILGLERGLERAIGETRIVAFLEIEAFICENLVQEMEQGVLAPAPIWTDVKTFVKIAKHFRNKVHIITGGYPCQPFSTAGQRKGTTDPRHLFPYIEKIIDAVRPVCCFFENVDDHLSLGFAEVYASLRRLGYTVEDGVYTAAEVGAPHERARLFILAIRNDCMANAEHNGMEEWFRSIAEHYQQNGAQFYDKQRELLHRDRLQWDEEYAEEQRLSGTLEKITGRNGQSVLGEGEPDGQGFELSTGNENLANATQQPIYGSGQSEQRGGDEYSNESNGRSEILEHSEGSTGRLSICEQGQRRKQPINSTNIDGPSEAMANTKCQSGQQGDTAGLGMEQNPLSENGRQQDTNRPAAFGENVSNATNQRLQKRGSEPGLWECEAIERSSINKWPAGPGNYQHQWEHERTIEKAAEPAMGLSANGYNFREDILRAVGNSAVEQQTEFAFIDLIRKQLKNISRNLANEK